MTLVIQHAEQLVTVGRGNKGPRCGTEMRTPDVIRDGAMMVEGDRVAWIGPSKDLPVLPPGAELIDATGKIVLPGLIDSHTHLIFAGTREQEFESRLLGRSYQEIATAGGGINATVHRVRQATKEQLKQLARPRLERMLRFGITTVEVKSGYGLSLPDEIKCLEAIADLNAEGIVELVPTFLGAHAVPPECRDNRTAYVQMVSEVMLREVVRCRLARFCDVFCDVGAFTLEETRRILEKARDLGLGLKLHADELSALGGAELAAGLGAASADHLLRITDAGIDALAHSGTIASLLPGTAFFLGLDYAPARLLIERGAAVALASDCNPGTCPSENLPLAGAIACTQMKMLPAEVVTALTINAAAAVGETDRLGSLETGKQADIVICAVPSYAHLFYHFGVNHVWRVIKRGRVVHAA